MRSLSWLVGGLMAVGQLAGLAEAGVAPVRTRAADAKIAPKVVIISMFSPEANIWYEHWPSSGLGDIMAHNISVPGLSMLFPHVHCTEDHSVCQFTTGEAVANAAATVAAVVLSGKFDLTETYFVIAGIAGVNPKQGTLGSVALSKYAVQIDLQYEIDAREMPANFSTGYFSYGTDQPGVYPSNIYGSEVFELNEALRDIAFDYASNATLADSPETEAYRDKYLAEGPVVKAATEPPSVVKCDAATGDVYYSGSLLAQAFENLTTVWTNGSGVYCMSAQEDNATLEVLVRMAIEGLVDFGRIILMRTGSDFDRPPPGVSAFEHLRLADQNGFGIAVENIYRAGVEIVKGVLDSWDCLFQDGVETANYVGDIFGSLGGEPDFGPGSLTDGAGVLPGGRTGDLAKRAEATERPALRRRRSALPAARASRVARGARRL